MSRTTYIIFSTIIIVISMIISYGSSDSDGSRMHSGGYYGGGYYGGGYSGGHKWPISPATTVF